MTDFAHLVCGMDGQAWEEPGLPLCHCLSVLLCRCAEGLLLHSLIERIQDFSFPSVSIKCSGLGSATGNNPVFEPDQKAQSFFF